MLRKMGRLTWEESSADHSWQDNEKHREEFQISCKHWSTFGMGEVLGRESSLDHHLQAVQKGSREWNRSTAERAGSILSVSPSQRWLSSPGSQCVFHAKDSFPTSLTAACCHPLELSPQARGERSVEISFTGMISPLAEMKPPSGLQTAAVWQQETRSETDWGCFGQSSVVRFHNYPIWKYRSTTSRETHTAFLFCSLKRNKGHETSGNMNGGILSGGLLKVTAQPAPDSHFYILVMLTAWRLPVLTSPQWDKDGWKQPVLTALRCASN